MFINFAQHVQYGQQQVYLRHDLKLSSSCMDESLTSPSTEVKIKLKYRDWEVEITCIENRVKQVVENVLSGIDTSPAITTSTNSQISSLKQEIDSLKLQMESEIFHKSQLTSSNISPHVAEKLKVGTTCRGILEDLWYEGYFKLEKLLGEVHEELSRRGYNYDRTAVSHSLTDMVRESILTRVGTMRNYRYIQKRPPSESTFITRP